MARSWKPRTKCLLQWAIGKEQCNIEASFDKDFFLIEYAFWMKASSFLFLTSILQPKEKKTKKTNVEVCH